LSRSEVHRKWLSHDPAKWDAFKAKYRKELQSGTETINRIQKETKKATVTFLFPAKDAEHNNAVALKEFIERKK
jgi:uncharacterized protein YeaO (DUF488 family)